MSTRHLARGRREAQIASEPLGPPGPPLPPAVHVLGAMARAERIGNVPPPQTTRRNPRHRSRGLYRRGPAGHRGLRRWPLLVRNPLGRHHSFVPLTASGRSPVDHACSVVRSTVFDSGVAGAAGHPRHRNTITIRRGSERMSTLLLRRTAAPGHPPRRRDCPRRPRTSSSTPGEAARLTPPPPEP